MGTALYGVDVVYVGIDLLGIAGVVLEGYLDRDGLVGLEVDRLADKALGPGVQVLHELAKAVLRIEDLAAVVVMLHSRLVYAGHLLPEVGEADLDALVQIGKLAQTSCKYAVLVNRMLEDACIRMEGNGGAGVRSLAYDLHLGSWMTLGEGLDEDLALAVHLRLEEIGQGVHARHAHAVETSGNLVGILAELAAGVKHGEHDLKGASVLLLMHTGRNASSVVPDRDRIVRIDKDLYMGAEACKGLVYTVVNHLIYQMVESSLTYVSDIH